GNSVVQPGSARRRAGGPDQDAVLYGKRVQVRRRAGHRRRNVSRQVRDKSFSRPVVIGGRNTPLRSCGKGSRHRTLPPFTLLPMPPTVRRRPLPLVEGTRERIDLLEAEKPRNLPHAQVRAAQQPLRNPL